MWEADGNGVYNNLIASYNQQVGVLQPTPEPEPLQNTKTSLQMKTTRKSKGKVCTHEVHVASGPIAAGPKPEATPEC